MGSIKNIIFLSIVFMSLSFRENDKCVIVTNLKYELPSWINLSSNLYCKKPKGLN